MPPFAAERLQRHKPDRGGGELEVADQQLPLLLAPLPLDEEQLVSGHAAGGPPPAAGGPPHAGAVP